LKKYCFLIFLVLQTIIVGSPQYLLKQSFKIEVYETSKENEYIALEYSKDSLCISSIDIHRGIIIQKNFASAKYEHVVNDEYFDMITDGDFFIVVFHNRSVVKLDSKFNVIWEINVHDYPYYSYKQINKVFKALNGYIVCNEISPYDFSHNDDSYYTLITKIDLKGNIEWSKKLDRCFFKDCKVNSESDIYILAKESYFIADWANEIGIIRGFKYLREIGVDVDEKKNPLNYKKGAIIDNLRIIKLDDSGEEIFNKKIYRYMYDTVNIENSIIINEKDVYVLYHIDKRNNYNITKIDDFGNPINSQYIDYSKTSAEEFRNECCYIKRIEIGSYYNNDFSSAYLLCSDSKYSSNRKFRIKDLLEKNNINHNYTDINNYSDDYEVKIIKKKSLLYFKLDLEDKIILKVIDLNGY
jgi:hypothetical protein